MVQAISGFRPYVSAVPTITQQQRVNQVKLERHELTDDLRNGKISDIQAMSQQIALDSKLSDAKAQTKSVQNTAEVKSPTKTLHMQKPQEIQRADVRAMDRQQKGKELTQVEKQQFVEKQMQQMAINNQVLHGLIAV